MTALQWSRTCDQPLKVYMLLHGIAGVGAALFFMATEAAYMESTDPDDDGSLRGQKKQVFVGIILYFLLTGLAGTALYFSSKSCENAAYTTYRWTWAAVLLFMIMSSMLFSDVFGKLGAPFFSSVGHLFGSVFQSIADLFNTLGDVLAEGPADPENVPPARSAGTVFAMYINHAAFLWFFLYIFFEAWKERKLPCDMPLKTYLYGLSILGTAITYIHFLFSLFAGVKTRERLQSSQKLMLAVVGIAFVVWGIVGFRWVHGASTCMHDGHAVNTYRLAFLLTCCLGILFGLGGVFMCAGILDFLCGGKMRLVVVISSGNEEDDDDDLQA
eukprot:c45837_g1_i1.p1 GENE.c45837_g1_i1~~c45837_g1_i1.p1  ORF type:complete len:384 (+),score=75.52 c45837_g1_i1:169-1152(+)